MPEVGTNSKASIARRIDENRALVMLCVLFVGLSLTAPNFLSIHNITTILRGSTLNGIVAIGFTVIFILGHLDLVRRDSWELFGEVLPLAHYREPITTVLRRLIDAGRGLEINTSALRKGFSQPVPGLTALRWYRELGGEIVVFGSDGHRPADVAYGFDVARDLALAAGFHRVAEFRRREIVNWIEL